MRLSDLHAISSLGRRSNVAHLGLVCCRSPILAMCRQLSVVGERTVKGCQLSGPGDKLEELKEMFVQGKGRTWHMNDRVS